MNKTLVLLISMTLMLKPTTCCSLSRGFVFAKIPESAELAGAIIVGTVENERDPRQFIDEDIYLTDAVYYKGCGPSRVRVSGYSSSSMCGFDTPKAGRRVMVFVCRDGEGWKLHNFAAYAGQFEVNEENLKTLVDSVGDKSTCEGEGFAYKQCQKRKQPSFKPIVQEKPEYILKPVTPTLEKPPTRLVIPPKPPLELKPQSISSTSAQNPLSIGALKKISNPFMSSSKNFPAIPRPAPVQLNSSNSMVSETTRKLPRGFNSFFSGLMDSSE